MKFDFDQCTERRGTHSFKWDSEQMKQDPQLLPLFVADMDFKTAPCVIEALQECVDHGIFGYTQVWDEYYEALTGWMKRRHDWDIEKEWILPFPGIVPAIKLAIRVFTKPDDEILVFKPVYYPFDKSIEMNHRSMVEFQLDEANGEYSIDFEKLEKLLQEKNIKMLIFCNPHNPIGRVWRRDELEQLGKLCLKYGVFVFSDEIHMDFTYGNHPFIPMLAACPELKKQIIAATAPSKTFNLAGLSVSNLIIPEHHNFELLKAEMDASGISSPNVFGLRAAEAAYSHGDEWLDELLSYLEGNFDFMRDWFAANMPQITMKKPEGLYLAWVDFRNLGLDENELEDFMLHEAHVWLDEGYIFGHGGEGYERFNCACPRSVLEETLNRIKTAWDKRNS